MQRIRGRYREALAGGGVVLQALQLRCGNVQHLPRNKRVLPRLIVNQLAAINRKSRCDRPIE